MSELTESLVAKFQDAFRRGIDGIVEAAQIYVKAIDADPNAPAVFKDRFADCIPASAWSGFERVGRKQLHPKLLLGGMANRRVAAHVRRLPYSSQERVFNKERFDLLLLDGQTLKVSPLECNPEQAEQLFDGPVIRDIPAQRAYLETITRKARTIPDAEPLPYIIAGGRVTFRRGTVVSKAELKKIIEAM